MKKIMIIITALWLLPACKKDDPGKPVKEKMLPVKIFDEGKLSIHIFYNPDHAIDSIRFFYDTGLPWHTDVFEKNASGRVKNVHGKYFSPRDPASFHEEKIEMAYKEGQKIKSTRYSRYNDPNDSLWHQLEEFTYEYPHPQNIIVKEFTEYGELKRTREYLTDKSGNIIEENYIVAPMFLPVENSYHRVRTFDRSISPRHLIDEKLPGYYDGPVSPNNLLNFKSVTETGEISLTVTYKNEYNAAGYLIKQTGFAEDGAIRESYRFEYVTVKF